MRASLARCINKRPYYSKAECEAAIRRSGSQVPLFAYKCPECERWHMTKHDPREYGMRKGERG